MRYLETPSVFVTLGHIFAVANSTSSLSLFFFFYAGSHRLLKQTRTSKATFFFPCLHAKPSFRQGKTQCSPHEVKINVYKNTYPSCFPLLVLLPNSSRVNLTPPSTERLMPSCKSASSSNCSSIKIPEIPPSITRCSMPTALRSLHTLTASSPKIGKKWKEAWHYSSAFGQSSHTSLSSPCAASQFLSKPNTATLSQCLNMHLYACSFIHVVHFVTG